MNEMLVQYLWNFKIFKNFNFKDTDGHALEILDFGKWNHNSGPDFLMGKIRTQNVVLVGNIEIHLKSSDWIFHHHSQDQAFDNVILHVVLQNDVELQDFKEKNIPTLELDSYIDREILWKYESLAKESQFIACEKIFDPRSIPFYFSEETLLKKMDEKATEIEESLRKSRNDFEGILFEKLAYAFGLKVNAIIFKQLAESIGFPLLQKIRQDPQKLEALFFGRAGWLQKPEDTQSLVWQQEYHFLQKKYKLPEIYIRPKFMRLRPSGFPTLRLSQLAHLYHREPHLFSRIMQARSVKEIRQIFLGIKTSSYWNSHYNFGKITSKEQEKFLSSDFINLLLINAVLPVKYACHKNHDEEIAGEVIEMYRQIPPEKNLITEEWKALGVPVKSALDSQAFLYHYNTFCIPKKCLNCSIGLKLLKNNPKA